MHLGCLNNQGRLQQPHGYSTIRSPFNTAGYQSNKWRHVWAEHFYGNEGPLVCYYTVRTLEDAFVGKAQVVLEGRDRCSMSVPEGNDIAAGRPARNGSSTDKQTRTHTCSRCNLWWQTRAGLGSGPGGVVITHFHCDHHCVCVGVFISSLPIHHDQMWVHASAGLLLSPLLVLSGCRTASQGGGDKKSKRGSAHLKLSNFSAKASLV